jgi:hypothetical protein
LFTLIEIHSIHSTNLRLGDCSTTLYASHCWETDKVKAKTPNRIKDPLLSKTAVGKRRIGLMVSFSTPYLYIRANDAVMAASY